MATESGGDETGGPGDETGDKTVATAGWRPWACHATNHKNFIYQPIFTIFAAKNQQSAGYNHTKKY